MTNKSTLKTKTYKAGDNQELVNQPVNASIAPTFGQGSVSAEVASHQYQANSPAINTNAHAGYAASTDSILDKIQTPEKVEAQEDAAEQRLKQEKANLERNRFPQGSSQGSLSDYDYRTTLDVSNPLYINPSLGHYKKAK